jgi:hypothetical protein
MHYGSWLFRLEQPRSGACFFYVLNNDRVVRGVKDARDSHPLAREFPCELLIVEAVPGFTRLVFQDEPLAALFLLRTGGQQSRQKTERSHRDRLSLHTTSSRSENVAGGLLCKNGAKNDSLILCLSSHLAGTTEQSRKENSNRSKFLPRRGARLTARCPAFCDGAIVETGHAGDDSVQLGGEKDLSFASAIRHVSGLAYLQFHSQGFCVSRCGAVTGDMKY